ncbi:MAG: hypothetical protein FWE13_03310 [Firmicutes bacterium]|nr:hypothetical protein [Bacillota bacterium]
MLGAGAGCARLITIITVFALLPYLIFFLISYSVIVKIDYYQKTLNKKTCKLKGFLKVVVFRSLNKYWDKRNTFEESLLEHNEYKNSVSKLALKCQMINHILGILYVLLAVLAILRIWEYGLLIILIVPVAFLVVLAIILNMCKKNSKT